MEQGKKEKGEEKRRKKEDGKREKGVKLINDG
jgi:hypothetical protein